MWGEKRKLATSFLLVALAVFDTLYLASGELISTNIPNSTKAALTLCLASYDNATVGGWSLYFMLPTENCRAAAPRGRQSGSTVSHLAASR